ncbi:zinc ABC transporter substrate-binding protein [Caldibacillus lycopersici]|uniref:Zinc ABC transporter substrate-binding protein n=1 Tax=Perspicuibacillus lycopersici TaxID=1325689 RepID=A0AAE3LLX4_9BACI|nr:zinc ABC transporter substrate-binding protein [Perspicuibacillus lycopersici]MCU9612910.1 zinc ABC transporter substrate-binding protein [Perspicuibacillus lycopersici]
MKRLFKRISLMLIMAVIVFLAACSSQEGNGEADGKIQVVTTIAQIGEPISIIGGDKVEVKSLMGPSVDPHLYNATHGDITTMDNADIVFYSGLHLEANMVEIFEEIGKTKPVAALGEAIPKEALLYDETGAVDPHIWFDIDLWKQALHAAVEELKAFSPENADYFEENEQKYFAELDSLKEEAKKLAEIPEEQRVLVTAHDAFGYFGRMHQIKVVGLQGISTESEIGVSDIQETIELIKQYKVPAVFIESSINKETIQAVMEGAKSEGLNIELGGELYSDAMGEAGTEVGTYIGMYRHNINTIYEALRKGVE